jgi:hypothetical protein
MGPCWVRARLCCRGIPGRLQAVREGLPPLANGVPGAVDRDAAGVAYYLSLDPLLLA